MKKNLVFLLIVVLAITFVGCGNSNTTNGNNLSENISSDEPASSVESTVEDDKPHGIEGLIDKEDSPAGKTYLRSSGSGFTGYFSPSGEYTAQLIETGEWKPKDKWEKLANGQIKKIYKE